MPYTLIPIYLSASLPLILISLGFIPCGSCRPMHLCVKPSFRVEGHCSRHQLPRLSQCSREIRRWAVLLQSVDAVAHASNSAATPVNAFMHTGAETCEKDGWERIYSPNESCSWEIRAVIVQRDILGCVCLWCETPLSIHCRTRHTHLGSQIPIAWKFCWY